MADLSITAADVAAGGNAYIETLTAGVTIAAGQPVYIDEADDNKAKLADADNQDTAKAVGIAVSSASDGQQLFVLKSGDLTVTTGVTVGEHYVVSTTAGGIAPEADLASNDYVTYLGGGISATKIRVKINVLDVAIP